MVEDDSLFEVGGIFCLTLVEIEVEVEILGIFQDPSEVRFLLHLSKSELFGDAKREAIFFFNLVDYLNRRSTGEDIIHAAILLFVVFLQQTFALSQQHGVESFATVGSDTYDHLGSRPFVIFEVYLVDSKRVDIEDKDIAVRLEHGVVLEVGRSDMDNIES